MEFSSLTNYLGTLHQSECLIFLVFVKWGVTYHLAYLLVVRINEVTCEKCLKQYQVQRQG